MNSLSVVIISKNASLTIAEVIASALKVTTDVLLVDSGSTDGTKLIATQLGARTMEINWRGFGAARNEGAKNAQGDFILYLDSDEVITPGLVATLSSASLDTDVLYGFRRRNFVGDVEVHYGEWGHDAVYRLHHKSLGGWNLDEVHEQIVVNTNKNILLKGDLLHYTTPSIPEYASKLEWYASLSAANYYKKNRKVSSIKPAAAALFNFVKNYIFRLGILDGSIGWQLARLHARYTYMKYKKLRRLY